MKYRIQIQQIFGVTDGQDPYSAEWLETNHKPRSLKQGLIELNEQAGLYSNGAPHRLVKVGANGQVEVIEVVVMGTPFFAETEPANRSDCKMNFSAFRRDYREHGVNLACAAADSACVPGAVVAAWLNRIAAKASRVVHENGLTDKRYTVALESAGHPSPVYVARFGGEFILASDTAAMAWRAAGAHKQARGFGGGLG